MEWLSAKCQWATPTCARTRPPTGYSQSGEAIVTKDARNRPKKRLALQSVGKECSSLSARKTLDTNPRIGCSQAIKVARRSSKQPTVDFGSKSFGLSCAKTYLGRLMEKASKGEVVSIVRGQRRFILQEVPQTDPIPIRPPGYFANAYTAAEIQDENRLAKASVIGVPKDLD